MADASGWVFPNPIDMCALTLDVAKGTIALIVAYEMGRAEMQAQMGGGLRSEQVRQIHSCIWDRISALDLASLTQPLNLRA